MTPDPFGYFKPDPFGWTDCAETDEGARPLYDQDTVDALIAEHADVATLEQESRQMRARMERLEKELETERAWSFRNQVAELEKQRDDLLAALNLWKLASDNAEESELDDMACYCMPMPLFCDADEATDAAIASAKESK